MMAGSPSAAGPAAISRPRPLAAARRSPPGSSSPRPSRTASSGTVHDDRPGPSAATNEYGQPGITCPAFFPAPVHVAEHPLRAGLRFRPQPARRRPPPAGSARPARPAAAAPPAPSAAAPTSARPRSARRTPPVPPPELRHQRQPRQVRHPPRPHSTASARQNSASARRVKHRYTSPRNPSSPLPRRPVLTAIPAAPPGPRHTKIHGHRLIAP